MSDLIIVTKDDHGDPIYPLKILLNGKLYQLEPDPNGWRINPAALGLTETTE